MHKYNCSRTWEDVLREMLRQEAAVLSILHAQIRELRELAHSIDLSYVVPTPENFSKFENRKNLASRIQDHKK
jgi:hypothetical protein